MFKKIYTLALAVMAFNVAFAETITITDSDLQGNTTYNWTADNEYVLDGYVFLEEGGVLNIEAGTVVRGKADPSGDDPISALIIARGAQIFAIGTATNPVIFTGEFDQLDGGFTATDNKTWGGLIILGNAPIGEDDGEETIEGVSSNTAGALYGGDNADDNSGVLKYVSLRHGGAEIAADNEINGLTLGGVGRGTTIDFIEVFANKDDGIEFFGGNVNVKHAVVAFQGDDALDFDESWGGYVQFALTLQQNEDTDIGDNAVEYDGTELSTDATGGNVGRIYNATFIGSGNGTGTSQGLRMKKNGAAQFWNCVWMDLNGPVFRFQDAAIARLEAEETVFANNIAFNYESFKKDEVITDADGNVTATNVYEVPGVTTENPNIGGVSHEADGGLDPRPNAGSVLLSNVAVPSFTDEQIEDGYANGVISNPGFRGAFGSGNWATGWTALDAYGYFGNLSNIDDGENVVEVTDAAFSGCNEVLWTTGKEYILDGYVFVDSCSQLTIEPGVIVRGRATGTNGDATSALIIARGAKLYANGTADQPIIFTSEFDILDEYDDYTATSNKAWGGLIMLGDAPIGEDGGQEAIEGISSDNESRVVYGGNNADDNSGVVTYVSIRHGGNELAADNEINGFTLGGVGRGTTIDHVEVFANKDDGIEIFGGNVNLSHLVVAFQGDDAFDFDESWDGSIQYLFSLQQEQDSDIGDNAIEYDGTEDSGDATGGAVGKIYNGTFIGSGNNGNGTSNGLRLKKNGAAQFWNCVWTDLDGSVFRIQDQAVARLIGGETVFASNMAYNYETFKKEEDGNGYTISGVTVDVDPQLASIGRLPNNMLDPRPADNNSPLLSDVATPNVDGIDNTYFRGAFGDDYWIQGWTALSSYGYLAEVSTSVNYTENAEGVRLNTATPNPTAVSSLFVYELPATSKVNFTVTNIQGQVVAQYNVGVQAAGENQFDLSVAGLANGLYIVSMQTEQGTVTQKLTVQK